MEWESFSPEDLIVLPHVVPDYPAVDDFRSHAPAVQFFFKLPRIGIFSIDPGPEGERVSDDHNPGFAWSFLHGPFNVPETFRVNPVGFPHKPGSGCSGDEVPAEKRGSPMNLDHFRSRQGRAPYPEHCLNHQKAEKDGPQQQNKIFYSESDQKPQGNKRDEKSNGGIQVVCFNRNSCEGDLHLPGHDHH